MKSISSGSGRLLTWPRSRFSQARPSWYSWSGETIEELASPSAGRSLAASGVASRQASVSRVGRRIFIGQARRGQAATLAAAAGGWPVAARLGYAARHFAEE